MQPVSLRTWVDVHLLQDGYCGGQAVGSGPSDSLEGGICHPVAQGALLRCHHSSLPALLFFYVVPML